MTLTLGAVYTVERITPCANDRFGVRLREIDHDATAPELLVYNLAVFSLPALPECLTRFVQAAPAPERELALPISEPQR